MWCSNCRKEVDINSVSHQNSARHAGTFTNEDGMSITRISQGDSRIVNVCKSCGESSYLFKSKEHFEAEIESQKTRDSISAELTNLKLRKTPRRLIILGFLFFFISTVPLLLYLINNEFGISMYDPSFLEIELVILGPCIGAVILLLFFFRAVKLNKIKRTLNTLKKLNS